MSFLGSIGKTFVQTFKQPQNILVPPLGIAVATTKLAAPLVGHAVASIKGAIANQAIVSAAPSGPSMTGPHVETIPYSYPQYSTGPVPSYFYAQGGSPWDSSIYSPTYPAGTISPPSEMYSGAPVPPWEQPLLTSLSRSLDPFQ